ncbi:amidohydrolase [Aeromonas salmonicida]|uniref:amidohydrolase n=1 Tax=Aeromonas salmonicida TaxID=645 RepID=UPI00073CB99B|nr:amidohydrolase family protein [Aeromonas salmonicida]KTA79927.1 amidohydrolase [Aeromonas salmonicida]MDE7528741.1 amidohydrolase family protein [Aeromonas salmonicida]MDE7533037.1 amidohydrolase family protein [Aeromonas salmonicida]UUI62900.1 amidohydrolase family protein [Aeromonas salmonicida]
MDGKQQSFTLSAALLLMAGLLTGCNQESTEPTAQRTLYLNGKIHTQDEQRRVAEAMVVADGKFLYVGTLQGAKAYQTAGSQSVDLKGRMVLPGLHDNHIHLLGTVALDMCDLDGQSVTLDQLADKIKTCLPRYASGKGNWLVVNQWSPYDGNTPTATHATLLAALDVAAPDNPVVLFGVDGHASVYNSQALASAQDQDGNTVGFNDVTLAPGGVFAHFQPYVDLTSGVIREGARSAIPVPETTVLNASDEQAAAEYDKILPAVSSLMASRGITGIQDACATDFIRQRLLNMQKRGLLHMRVTAATCFHQDDYSGKLDIAGHLAKASQVRSAFADNPLIKADAVKIFLDGVLEGDPFTSPPFLPNAGMLENYHSPHLALDPDSGEVSITADSEDAGSNGIVNYKEADLTRYVTALDGAGFGIHMHSIGDRSTRVALDALEAARASNGESGIPHTLAHLQVVHPDDQKRLGELGLYLTFTYAWTTPQLAYDMLVSPFIQPTRVGQSLSEAIYDPMGYLHDALYPVESSRQAGAVLVAGSDAPVDSRDPRPFENMAAGIVKAAGSGDDFRASQRTSLAEMLAAYTINGARAVRQEAITGSIEAGKSADFIVLDRDLFALVKAGTPEQIAQTRVEQTVFMGETVYRKP